MPNELENGYRVMSVCYNGKQLTKAEIILYLHEIIKVKKEIQELSNVNDNVRKEIKALEALMVRQTVYMPVVEKPRGLASLSKKRKQEYQQWLLSEPQREEERARLEAKEDERIAKLKKRVKTLHDESWERTQNGFSLSKKYTELMQLHIIAPEYRKDNIPELLLNYLLGGRASTLAEALNIYHEEEHRMQMLSIAQKQLYEARKAQQAQLDLAWQQMEVLNETKELQRQALETAKDAKRAAENAEFYSLLNLFTN